MANQPISTFHRTQTRWSSAQFYPLWWDFGAPRSIKMGTTPSSSPYDAAASHALQLANLRRPATLHYASWLPDIAGWSACISESGHAERIGEGRDVPLTVVNPPATGHSCPATRRIAAGVN